MQELAATLANKAPTNVPVRRTFMPEPTPDVTWVQPHYGNAGGIAYTYNNTASAQTFLAANVVGGATR